MTDNIYSILINKSVLFERTHTHASMQHTHTQSNEWNYDFTLGKCVKEEKKNKFKKKKENEKNLRKKLLFVINRKW